MALYHLELTISKKGKKAKCNHIEQRKLSQYVGNMNVVMFAPEDLNLVKGSPQVRRRFIDMEIGQVSPVYLHDMSQYHKILQQRNHYLKHCRPKNKRIQTMLDDSNRSIYSVCSENCLKDDLNFLNCFSNGQSRSIQGYLRS